MLGIKSIFDKILSQVLYTDGHPGIKASIKDSFYKHRNPFSYNKWHKEGLETEMSLPGMAFHIYLQSQNNLATSEKKRRHVFLKHAEVISFMNAGA